MSTQTNQSRFGWTRTKADLRTAYLNSGWMEVLPLTVSLHIIDQWHRAPRGTYMEESPEWDDADIRGHFHDVAEERP